MKGREAEPMPYGLLISLLLIGLPIGIFWSSIASLMNGAIGLAAGAFAGLLLILTSSYVDRLMVQRGYRESRAGRPISTIEWIWFAVTVSLLGAMAIYSAPTPFVGFIWVVFFWSVADFWSRRKLVA